MEDTVSGEGTITYVDDSFDQIPEKNSATVRLTGGFYRDRFLKLQYENIDNDSHLGEVLLELKEDNTVLEGKFVGHGIEFDEIVTGLVYLRKARALHK